MKIPKKLNWKLRLVQDGYDLGWEHGYKSGLIEGQNKVVEFLTDNIETIDWLKEEPLGIRDIIPMVKNYEEEVKEVTWEK